MEFRIEMRVGILPHAIEAHATRSDRKKKCVCVLLRLKCIFFNVLVGESRLVYCFRRRLWHFFPTEDRDEIRSRQTATVND